MVRHLKEKPKLNRTLSFWQATLCGIGIILGAGIYVLIGEAAALGGNSVWISFLLAAVVAGLTGLSYAELSSMFPRTAGEYLYAKNSFGKRIGFLAGWLIVIAQIIAAAAVALGFARYFSRLFLVNLEMVVTIAMSLIILSGLVLFKGIKESAGLAIAFTLIEAAGLFIIIFIGLPYFGSVNYLEVTSVNIGGIFAAAALIFFAFIGFEEIVQLAEETKNPQKSIPRSVIASIAITAIIYVLVAISAVSVLGWEALANSPAPLADVAAKVFGEQAFLLLGVIALFSTANTVLLIMLSNSRIVYGLAKNNALPKKLGNVHSKTRTPYIAIIGITLLTLAFATIGDIGIVASLTNYMIFTIFIIVNSSVIALRFIEVEGVTRNFKVPGNIGKFPIIPTLGILSCIVLLFNVGLEILFYGTLMLLLGVIVFELFIKKLQNEEK